jgi:hypothetical protein
MAQIYVPTLSPFSVSGPSYEADDSHIQSHHLAYEVATLNRRLQALYAEYEAQASLVTAMQASPNRVASKLKLAEKSLLSSMLPHEIKRLRARLKVLNRDLMSMTRA